MKSTLILSLLMSPFVLGLNQWKLRTHRNSGLFSSSPFSSMIGDMASSIFGKSNVVEANDKVDSVLQASSTETWSGIRQRLESVQTAEERAFRDNLALGYGIGSPLHLVRLYDTSNRLEDIRVTFYRDSASWCPYCQKVWLTLEEKRIPYKVEKINMRCYGEKPGSFTRIQPGGQIPVAIIDGVTYGQSNDILWALEEKFGNHKSLKPLPPLASKAQEYFRLERQLFSAWMYWLTGNGGQRAKTEFVQVLTIVEKALEDADGPFFLGKDISQVDIQFTPFLERMVASLLFFKGYQIRVTAGSDTDYPAINKWFDAMETLPSYRLTKSDYYTHCWDLPPQLGGCTFEPDGKPFEDAINGLRRIDGTMGSWELPLQPNNGGIEPDWEWAGDEESARREAIERITGNHEAITRFAARGAGEKGVPSFMAPLSDPNATSNEAVVLSVDEVLRIVCLALLEGTENQNSAMAGTAKVLAEDGGKEFSGAVVASLSYLRDRIGVPRDMKLPAARQLRAHLNWAIGIILDALD